MTFKYLLLFCTFFLVQPLFAQSNLTKITLTVDMMDREIDSTGIFVVGNFFNGSPEFLDDNGDGTWSYTATFTKGDTLLYLFQNGSETEQIEESSCLFQETNQRIYIIPQDDAGSVVKACFSSCMNCADDEMSTSAEDLLLEQLAFKVYPNPIRNQAIVSWKSTDIIIERMQMVDLNGKEIRRYTNFSGNQLTIDRSNLNSGIYFLRIIDASGFIGSKKIVVQ